MRAIKITTDNLISIAEIPEPTWQGLGQLVGGSFETVRPWGLYNLNTPYKKSLIMLVNEEGKKIGLDTNPIGTLLYNDTPSFKGVEPIVGDILIVAEGFKNGEPDIVGLYDEQIITVWRALKNKFSFLREKQCRAKKKKQYRENENFKTIKKTKPKLGSFHDCCGNCKSGLDIFSPLSVKCSNKVSPYFRVQMPKNKYCNEYK